MITSILLAVVLVNPKEISATSWKHDEPSLCVTKHGVTHCWEVLATDWDPRPPHYEWGNIYYGRPANYGAYPTEQKPGPDQ